MRWIKGKYHLAVHTAFLISHVTCYVIFFCKAIHTIDGLIECSLLFFFVKIKMNIPRIKQDLVIVEEGPTSMGAYVPDLPGCIAVGESREEAVQLIQEAIEFHLEGIKEEGPAFPFPHSSSEFVEFHL